MKKFLYPSIFFLIFFFLMVVPKSFATLCGGAGGNSGVCVPQAPSCSGNISCDCQTNGLSNYTGSNDSCDISNDVCCIPAPAPYTGNPGDCTYANGYCSNSPSCQSGYQPNDGSLFNDCNTSSQNFCCLPQTCGGVAVGARCVNTYQACQNSGGYPYPGDDFGCFSGAGYCCIPAGPTPTPGGGGGGGGNCGYNTAPGKPTGLATHADSVSCGYQDFNWTATPNATNYIIDWWFTTIDSVYHECQKTVFSNAGYISSHDNNVGEGTAGGDLCWTSASNLSGGNMHAAIFAQNCAGTSAPSSTINFSPVTSAPSTPQNLAVTPFCQAGGRATIKWSWDSTPNAFSYTHDRWYTPPGGSYTQISTTVSGTTYQVPTGSNAGWSNPGMAVGGSVRAVNTCGSSAFSQPVVTNVPQCVFTVSGTVFNDINHNGAKDGSESGVAGITVQLDDSTTNTTQTAVSDANGSYSFSGFDYGDNLSVSLPGPGLANQKVTSTNPVAIGNIAADTTVNFGVAQVYAISGFVYDDANNDNVHDAGDTYLNPGPTITISGSGLNSPLSVTTSTSDGSYTSHQVLYAGQYRVTYSSTLPGGYSFKNKIGTYTVTVGAGCSVGGNTEASCGGPNNNESADNLNFALTNDNAWVQPVCSDARYDGGYAQFIPSSANCSNTSGPYAIVTNPSFCPNTTSTGILFSGSADPSYGQGIGPSTNKMIVGDAAFPEVFTPRIPNAFDSSYSFVMTTLNNLSQAPTPLTAICPSLTNCVLFDTTPPGVYTTTPADGPVSISVVNSDGSNNLGQGNYTFVIGDDLTFTSSVTLSASSSAAFISAGDIHVSGQASQGNTGEVGESTWTSTTPDLEGFYSADGNFYVDRVDNSAPACNNDGSPIDKKLNIKGSVIVNAAGNGGNVVNNRDGCLQDLSCPVVTFNSDPLEILHAPGPLKPPYTFWQELNP